MHEDCAAAGLGFGGEKVMSRKSSSPILTCSAQGACFKTPVTP
jgi:hypothetical protein